MRTLRTAAFLAAAAICPSLHATTTTVVDIPAADGGMQRFLYVRPDAPIATLINIPGGNGILGIRNDGTMDALAMECNPVGRNSAAFASRRMGVVLVDQTTRGSIYNYDDIYAVVRYLRERDNVPVWITGGSASTSTVGLVAVQLPAGIPGGVIFNSPQRPASNIASIQRHSAVIYHPADPNQFASAMFNALTGAVVRERFAINAGTTFGCGYHLFAGADAEYVTAAAGFVERHNTATMAGPALNLQGLWWAGEAESGWGLNIAHQGDILFTTWFTYDTDGSAMWLVASGMTKTSGNTFAGTLQRTTGPAFSSEPFNAAAVTRTNVGTAILTFTDANAGRFDYTVNGVSRSKEITKLVFDPARVPVCTSGGSGTPNLQDLWIAPDPANQGWGLNVVHQGDILFATWFTYEAGGRGQWYVMSSLTRQSEGRYSGGIQRTTGPAFSAVPFNPTQVSRIDVGTAAIDFNATPATFTYTVGGATQTRQIQRYVFANPPTICR